MKMKLLSLALLSALAMTGCGGSGGSSEAGDSSNTGGSDGSGTDVTPVPTLDSVTVSNFSVVNPETKGLSVRASWDLLADQTGVEYTLCLSDSDPEVCNSVGSVVDGDSLTFKLTSLSNLESVKAFVQASKEGAKSKGAEVALDWKALSTSYAEDGGRFRAPVEYIQAVGGSAPELQWAPLMESVEIRYIDMQTERSIGSTMLANLFPSELSDLDKAALYNNSEFASDKLSGGGIFAIVWFDGFSLESNSFKGVSVHKIEEQPSGDVNFVNVDFVSAAEIGGGHNYANPRTLNASATGDAIVIEFRNSGDTPETQYEFLKLVKDGAEYAPTTGTLTDLEVGYEFESPVLGIQRKASHDFILSRNDVTNGATLRVYDSSGSPEVAYEIAKPEGFDASTKVSFEFVGTTDPESLSIALSFEGADHSESGLYPDASTGFPAYLKLDVNDVINGIVNSQYSMMPISPAVVNSLSEGDTYNMYNKFSEDFASHYVMTEVDYGGEFGGYVFAQLTESPIQPAPDM